MMIDLERTASFIRGYEGFSAKKYWDVDAWAIGYGEKDAEFVRKWEGGGLTPAIAYERLKKRVEEFSERIAQWFTREPTPNQFGAMTSLAYNIGADGTERRPGFRQSTVLRKFNGGDIQGAADAFLMWVSPGTEYEAGLRRRRQAEKEWFLSGTQDSPIPKEATGMLSLTNVRSGLALDVAHASHHDGAEILQWTITGRANQGVRFEPAPDGVFIRFDHSGKYLDAILADKGGKVHQHRKADVRAQTWRLIWGEDDGGPPGWIIYHPATNRVLDVPNGTTDRGVRLRTWPRNNSGAQLWVRTPF